MKDLTRENLGALDQRTLKVLQFGGGNFLRAFVDWMIQRMNDHCDYQGGIVLVKPTEGGHYEGLQKQDGLYHVVTSGFAKGKIIDEIELITCIDQIVQPYDDFPEFLESAWLQDLRIIVSNTTESGIVYEEEHPGQRPPKSFPGKLCVWLKSRFDFFSGAQDKGCIILPCELIEANGDKLKEIVIQYAERWKLGEEFIAWIEENNIFCNTLVDRIVPGKPDADAELRYEGQTGFTDHEMVVGEPYHLWAIEGPASIEEEFPLRKAGINAIYTDNLADFRLQKVRLLNGGHTSMVPVGLLAGISTVGEFVNNPDLAGFLEKTMREEIIPSIKEIDPSRLNEYADDVLDRFRNPFVQHKLSSIALNSISKFKVRILPSIEQFLKQEERLPERLMFSFAALIRFYQGLWKGQKLPLQDNPEIVQIFKQRWQEEIDGKISLLQLSESILADKKLWGRNLNEIPNLKLHLASALEIIERGDLLQELKRLS